MAGSNSARPCSSDIAGLYSAKDQAAFAAKAEALAAKFARLESHLGPGPWFDGDFSLVDAVFGPVFRYFDVFDRIGEFGVLTEQAQGRGLAQGARRKAVDPACGRRRLWEPAGEVPGGTPFSPLDLDELAG